MLLRLEPSQAYTPQLVQASELQVYSLQALEVNLNPLWYGVLAEIGAGQVITLCYS